MIVRALRSEPGITAGAEYVVLGIEEQTSQGVHVHLITDEGGRSHAVYPIAGFEVVDARLSRTWAASIERNRLTVWPAAWIPGDIWTEMYADYVDAMPLDEIAVASDRAHARFDAAVAEMHAEAERPWPGAPPVASDIPGH